MAPLGFELAIENFGSGRDPAHLLSHVPLNYVKIDGALMQGLANDRPLQEQVKLLVQEARTHGVTTIAERVEDANTMAVLWQLGIEFIQGYFCAQPRGSRAWGLRKGIGGRGSGIVKGVLAHRSGAPHNHPPIPYSAASSPSTFRHPRGSTPPRWPRSPRYWASSR